MNISAKIQIKKKLAKFIFIFCDENDDRDGWNNDGVGDGDGLYLGGDGKGDDK
jgi:hypothetical protein